MTISDSNHNTAVNAESGPLRIGTAKVDITSPEDALPFGYNSIHDHVYARAIVLDNHHTRAVLLGADLGMFTEDSYAELTHRIVQEVGCPVENILMSGTHTHGSPSPGAVPVPGRQTNVLDSFDIPYAERIKAGVFEAVRQANAQLQPARIGYGTGEFHVNVNRDAVHPDTRLWYQGTNLDGPSDKTVAVVNGKSVGYIPDDAAYERHTFQVLGARIQKGCAEQAIIRTVLDMMD